MERLNNCFLKAVKNRRSRYALENKSSIRDEELIGIVEEAVQQAPSAFNSQSTRVLILLEKQHTGFWKLVLEELRRHVTADKLAATEEKISSFAAGYGTLLFFEDWSTVLALQEKFPTYKENFPLWAYQANAMAEFIIWTALETAGLGASLQHYNPLIDEAVRNSYKVPKEWKLIAQMPFGMPTAPAADKTFISIKERVKVVK